MSAGQLRLGFAGTPEFAATVLSALHTAEEQVCMVYCQPDRPSGRGRRLAPNAVKALAQSLNLAIAQPPSLRNPQAQQDLAACDLDLLVVAAYGLILPQAILDTPRLGCINVHASLLPRWRGAAPVERAIMAGDHETGVSIMQMDAGLDTGPVYATQCHAITATTTGPSLEAELALSGANLLLECLQDIEARIATPQPDSGATYAKKLSKADAMVSWDQDANAIDQQIRALCDRQPATIVRGNLRIKLLSATPVGEISGAVSGTIVRSGPKGIVVACNPGAVILQRMQLNTGKGTILDAAAACNGYPNIFATGSSLASYS
jgi:methionyl-tRNA formyltransferase